MAVAVAGAHPDEQLAARDPGLPGLATALDGARFAALLEARAPWLGVREARATYVRYKPGTACVVAYSLTLADGERQAYVRLERPDSMDKLTKHAQRAGDGALLLPGLPAALYSFPADRRLPALAVLADEPARRRLLARAVPGRPDLWDATVTPVRWKPERRFVGALHGPDGPRALLKAYASDFARASRAAKTLGGREGPRTALRLGRSRRARVVVLEWLPGVTLREQLADADGQDAARAAGGALAQLHAGRASGLQVVTREHQVRGVLGATRTIERLVPALARDARRLAALIADRLPSDAGAALSHGDFSADQVLADQGRVALLDLDEAVCAHPAADLGAFLAALARDVDRGALAEQVAGAAEAALLEGYAAAARRAPATPAVRTMTAVALLRLAPEAFRGREPDWPEGIARSVARARALCVR